MDIRVNKVAELLKERGFDAESTEIVKNGVVFDSICIRRKDSNVSPTIYMKEILADAEKSGISLNEVVDKVIKIDMAHRKNNVDISFMNDKDYILSNIAIGLQRKGNEDLIKRDSGFDGIESYLYINLDFDGTKGTVKLNERIMEEIDLSEEEAWKYAERNLHNETVIQPLCNIISSLLGENAEDCADDSNMYVLTNKSLLNGASAVLDKDLLRKIGEKHGVTELYILPSSRHEMIVIPYSEKIEIETLNRMVREVNETQVDEVDRLTDRAYKIAI